MSEDNRTARSGCGPRLVWIARAVFSVLLVTGVVVAILWGSVTVYQLVQEEIERSAESVTTRFGAQESRIDVLRREVDDLAAANPGQEARLSQLQQEMAAVNSQLDTLAADLGEQNTLLAALEASMAVTLNNDETAAGSIGALNDGLTALQGDFNNASVRLDSFGGEVDDLTVDVTVLGETAVSAQNQAAESETAVTDMSQTLMLFRAWELIARARLRLLENNPGLAQADVEAADEMLQLLILVLPAEADTFQTVQTRLALASENLETNPDIAGSDLENAWDELDQILTQRLQPVLTELELGLGDALETPVASDNAVAQTPTPIPTTVPTSVNSPTPTPLPTSSPVPTSSPTPTATPSS